MNDAIDIYVDWTTQDDTGLPWTFIEEAHDPSLIAIGSYVIAGHGDAVAVAEVVAIADDGVVHLRQVPGPISANAHLLHQRAS